MTDFDYKEKRFEQDIETFLCTDGGYLKGDPHKFDRKLALDKDTLLSFIKTSQPKQWEKYTKIHGADSEKQIIDRFCREVKMVGLLRVLRQGFMDRGIKFYVVFWKPETSINEVSQKRYEANILHCTRQLHYSLNNENSIDIVLFLNGIPVVSMELKCQFTGQDTANAIQQYKFDRAGKDAIFTFKERVLVHFAVDLSQVYMTTRLEGSKTYFLPFNQGSNGAGNVGGKGNPINEEGYDTAYLWENVLYKDRLLEILHKYLHLQVDRDKKTGEILSERMIFPRYHQLDVVTKLLADVKQNGSGHNYLIQHSAGSGKSNSIAWLAHRLSGLHDANDEKIFQSVIIVTDRRVLDNQLQETVYQFDHVDGVVQKIDKNAQQLKTAIEDGVGIIITTLQKFPVIYKEVQSGSKRFAIIIDEAHSSQTGDAAKKLKRALADTEKILEEYAEMEAEAEEHQKDDEDRLLDELAAQGYHENMSFFAFTATPKDKTLNMFGWRDENGRYHPYHIYSMRQAIEEGFILDVLKNYMTYKMYYKIAKSIPDDPELDSVAGVRAILNYESLHPHNIAQKTAIMLEHFRNVTMHKIGGKAKAMVVTPSRLHAVRYLQEFKRQIKEKGYTDLDVLVAFSGEVTDHGETFTEEKLNKTKAGETIKEKALPEAFHTDEFGMLIVAEKYQTGFDEPLLHTMFVDKKLSSVKAVQTLSRLNRTTRGKQDTFVLDFVNSAEDIRKSFEPYYEETVLEEETNPNVVYDLKNTLDEYHVYLQMEIEKFAGIFYSTKEQGVGDLGKLKATISPALDRFNALAPERRDLFKSTLARFNRIYSFITQVCRLFDKDLHKFSVYAKFLYTMLPKGGTETVDVDDKVLLEYYRLEKDFDGGIELQPTEEGFRPITGEAGRREKKKDPLTIIIDKINKAYGTNFTEMDKVLLQIENDYAAEIKWQSYAQHNDRKTFMLLFEKDFPEMAAQRYEQNEDFFVRLFSEPDMMQQVMETIGGVLYERLKKTTMTDNHTSHSKQCKEIFKEIIQGDACVYLRLEDAENISDTAEQNKFISDDICFSVLSDKIIQYDAQFFLAVDVPPEQRARLAYRPYFISFMVPRTAIDEKMLKKFSSAWHKCIRVSKQKGFNSDDVVSLVTGTLLTSASPVNTIEKFTLKFTDEALPEETLEMIEKLYDPAQFPICNDVQPVLSDAWKQDTLQCIDIFNVGKGNADCISGKKQKILYDIGYDYKRRPKENEDRFPKAVAALRNLEPHCVILSHWDLDHFIGCAYMERQIFSVKWIAPMLDAGRINAIRLASYLNLFDNLCLIDRKSANKLIAKIDGPQTNISLWLGSGSDRDDSDENKHNITPSNCEGLFLEVNDIETQKNILLAGDVPYVCMPAELLQKTIHFLHVPHHCSKMSIAPLCSHDYKKGICAVISSYDCDGKRDISHAKALQNKYSSVYYTTEYISATSKKPKDSLSKRILNPFVEVTEGG